MEKQRVTPDVYPLSLNSLRLACNQSTNRDPVTDYDDAVIRDALHRLERRGYIRLASGAGSRASKYRHLLAEAMPFSGDEHAVMSVLMLRGPQTPGELKQRAERMHQFADLLEVQRTLERLMERGLVSCLGRRPGQKEDRYAHLLSDEEQSEPEALEPVPTAQSHKDETSASDVIASLTARVEQLEAEVAELRGRMRHPVGEPDDG